MDEDEHFAMNDLIKVKAEDLCKEELNANLFISSFSNYSNLNAYQAEECNKMASIPTFSFSTSNSSINMEDFEENFSSVFQTSHESDEYSAGFVRMLYMKYLSSISTQLDDLRQAHPGRKEKGSDNSPSAISILSNEVFEGKDKEQASEDRFNKLKKLKNISILSKGVFTAHVLQDGTIGMGSWGNSLFFFNPTTEETIEVQGHSGWVKYIIPLDNNRLASCSEDSTLKIWNSTSYECLGEFKADFATNGLMSIAQLSTNRVICGSSDGFLFIWDIANHVIVDSIQASYSGIFVIMKIDDDLMMIGSFDDHIYVLKLKPKLTQAGKLEGHKGWAKPLVRFKLNELITSGEDGLIKLWNLATLKCHHTLTGHKGGIWSGIVKNDSILFTGSNDCTIRVWDLTTYQCITIISEQSTVTALIELPGNRLIAGTFNNEITLYMMH